MGHISFLRLAVMIINYKRKGKKESGRLSSEDTMTIENYAFSFKTCLF